MTDLQDLLSRIKAHLDLAPYRIEHDTEWEEEAYVLSGEIDQFNLNEQSEESDPTPLECIICFYYPTTPHPTLPAITIIRGYAVCIDHMGYVAQGSEFHNILKQVRYNGVSGSH